MQAQGGVGVVGIGTLTGNVLGRFLLAFLGGAGSSAGVSSSGVLSVGGSSGWDSAALLVVSGVLLSAGVWLHPASKAASRQAVKAKAIVFFMGNLLFFWAGTSTGRGPATSKNIVYNKSNGTRAWNQVTEYPNNTAGN